MKSVLSLRRLLTTAAVMTIAIASQIASAQVSGGIRPSHPSQPEQPSYPMNPGYPGYNQDVVTVSVNQQFAGFSTIDVDAYFRYATQGRSITWLSVRMAAQGRAEAIVLVNGAPLGRPFQLSPYLQDYSFDLSRVYPGSRIELRLTGGQTYVQSMTAQLAYQPNPPPYPPPYPPHPPRPPHPPGPGPGPRPEPGQEVLTQYVNQLYNGRGVLAISSLVGLDRYQGRRVNRVIVRMRSERGQAQAVLINSGRRDRDAIPVSSYMSEHSFFPGNGRVGYEIRDLSVELRGRIAVESVSVELARW